MTPKSAKAKGRRLQQQVAEALSRAFGLTIAAVPPTRPRRDASGVVYVPESDGPDLGIRRIGEAGADVVLLSARARERVRIRVGDDRRLRSCWFEVKNVERWGQGYARGRDLWDRGLPPPPALAAYRQACAGIARMTGQPVATHGIAEAWTWTPVVVLGRNRHATVVVCRYLDLAGLRVDDGQGVIGGWWCGQSGWTMLSWGVFETLLHLSGTADTWRPRPARRRRRPPRLGRSGMERELIAGRGDDG